MRAPCAVELRRLSRRARAGLGRNATVHVRAVTDNRLPKLPRERGQPLRVRRSVAGRPEKLTFLGLADTPDIDELHAVPDRGREAVEMVAWRAVLVDPLDLVGGAAEDGLYLLPRFVVARKRGEACGQVEEAVDDDQRRRLHLGMRGDKLGVCVA